MEWFENTRFPGSRLLEASANPWSQPSGHYGVPTCDWEVLFVIMCQFFMNKFWHGLHVHMHLVFCKFSCGFIFSHCCISMHVYHVYASFYGVGIFWDMVFMCLYCHDESRNNLISIHLCLHFFFPKHIWI